MRRFVALPLLLALACGDDTPPPDAGLADDDFYVVVEGQTLMVEADAGVLTNDGGAKKVESFQKISDKLGTVVVNDDGSFAYVPLAGFWGHDTFTYSIDDPTLGPSIGTVNVMVVPVTLGLAGIRGSSRGFVLDGRAAGDQLGGSVAGLGDINGDQRDDFAVGAPLINEVLVNNGRAYVVLGHDSPGGLTSGDVAAGKHGFVINGGAEDDRLASSIAGAGDLNGDGLADMVVCAPREELTDVANDDDGRCYVVFGRAEFPAKLSLSEIADGNGGFAINGDGWQGRAGLAVAGGVDVDGDGRGDLVVGAPAFGEVEQDRGRAYLVLGKGSGGAVELADVAGGAGGFALDGLVGYERAGAAVGMVGDINGDGRGEILVGAPFATVGEVDYAGRAYLVYGRGAGGAASPDVVFRAGGTAASEVGGSVQGAGDMNGDGVPDLVIGAPQSKIVVPYREGRIYVVFGGADLPAEVDLGKLAVDGRGLVIDGEAQLYGNAGLVAAPAGDLDGDGFGDLLVGAPNADLGDVRGAGRSYVIFGREEAGTVNLADVAAGNGGFAIDGELEESHSGAALAAIGDIDGDDVIDLVVGAPNAAVAGNDAGRAYVIFGFGPPRR